MSSASREVRAAIRNGTFTGTTTAGFAPGAAQANLCILPKEYAFDFLLFCQRNPKPCPLLEVLEPGVFTMGDNIDIRTDLPQYRVFKDGELVGEPTDLTNEWRDDLVTFVIGCSFSFEEAMIRAGLPVRHVESGSNVPMYNTNIPCRSSGVFGGTMVVSMRPLTPAQALKATEITSRYARVHGAPIHVGSPEDIGILDLGKPDYGAAVEIFKEQGEVPVFWACGKVPFPIILRVQP